MYTIYYIMYTDNKKGVIKMSTVRINDNIKKEVTPILERFRIIFKWSNKHIFTSNKK